MSKQICTVPSGRWTFARASDHESRDTHTKSHNKDKAPFKGVCEGDAPAEPIRNPMNSNGTTAWDSTPTTAARAERKMLDPDHVEQDLSNSEVSKHILTQHRRTGQ